jgi:DNA repair protein RecN (Recombination protein N)
MVNESVMSEKILPQVSRPGRVGHEICAMLTALRIKNLALVADLSLEFQPGFNAISGETGAGKSILIGALNLLLGGRADRTLLRAGADSCTVEAVFDIASVRAPLAALLEEAGLEPCENHQLLLKRTFTAAGANRQFVNGSPTPLATLARLGEWLVDMHGPHEHQSLLQPARQLAILDAFGGLKPLREQFAGLVRKRAAVAAEKAALIVDERTYAQQLDLLRHQVREITAARLQPDEEETVTAEHARAHNAARLLQLCQGALGVLSEDDSSLLNQSGALGRHLQELRRLDPATAPLAEQHEQIVAALRDLQGGLSRFVDKLDLDPQRLRELEERLDLLHSLKRKYGASLAEVIAFGEDAGRRLELLESRDAELARLDAALQKLDAGLAQCGAELTRRRQQLIPKLSKAVTKHLTDLGFQRSEFTVALNTAPATGTPSLTGFDTVEFQFAPNPGEPARPLRAIASSGEMARVMLAIKTVLAAEDDVPVLVFDEVDANVGGQTAAAVGAKMRQISRQHQVLCVTHLAPVAAAASTHFVVTKQVEAGRTLSSIRRLNQQERIAELARMLGGQGAVARQHAEELLRAAAA